jgi:GH24 family phage-related lysozyme (muramidase)
MAKKTTEEIIAAEIKKVMDRQAREEVDLEDIGSILKSEGETQRRLVDLLEQANAKKKSKEGGSLIANIKKNIEAEGVHLKKLEAALKDNESFQKRLSKDVAKSRTLVTQAEAAPDDLNQGTAKLSSKAHSVKVGAPQLDGIIQGYAQRMSDVVTGMRALGLPAKQFAAKTLVILNKIKKEINVDPGLTDEDRLTKRAKKICLIFVKQHTSNITKAGALGPLASLKKSLVKSAKQGLGNTIKRLPGMGVMDRLAERMDITPLSERINKRLGGKKGSLDQEFVREGAAGVSQVAAEDQAAGEEGWESRSWGGQNSDTAQKMRLRSSAEAAVEVLEERVRELEAAADKSPREVGKKGRRLEGDGAGTLAVLRNYSPAPVGDSPVSLDDSPVSLDDSTGYSTGYSTGVSGEGDVVPILTRIADTLVETKEQDKKIHESEKAERKEVRDDANERRLASKGTAPIPALDESSNSPSPIPIAADEDGDDKGGGLMGSLWKQSRGMIETAVATRLGLGSLKGGIRGMVGPKPAAGGGRMAGLARTLKGGVGKYGGRAMKVGKGLLGRAAVPLAAGMDIHSRYSEGQSATQIGAGVAGGGLGAYGGALAGAAIGSAVPIVGTAIGGLVGGALGWYLGGKAADKVTGVGADIPPEADSQAMPTGAAPAASTRGVMTPTKKMIMAHEGVRHTPYKDSLGLWTVGVGHLIGDGKTLPDSMNKRFSDDEVFTMFDEDYEHHAKAARKIPGYNRLGTPAQGALEDLTFNMGPTWYKKWPNLTGQLSAGDTEGAARNLQGSKWYRQVGPGRGNKISGLIAADGGDGGASSTSPVLSADRESSFGDSEVLQVAGGTGRRYGGRGARGTASPDAAVQLASPAGASRSGTGVAAATSALASTGAGTTNNVTIVGSPPAPAAPPVTNLVPFPMPTQPRNPDPVYNSLQSVGGNSNA